MTGTQMSVSADPNAAQALANELAGTSDHISRRLGRIGAAALVILLGLAAFVPIESMRPPRSLRPRR